MTQDSEQRCTDFNKVTRLWKWEELSLTYNQTNHMLTENLLTEDPKSQNRPNRLNDTTIGTKNPRFLSL